jgi:hypothetical protein
MKNKSNSIKLNKLFLNIFVVFCLDNENQLQFIKANDTEWTYLDRYRQ